jgi:hypothetical protein
VASNLASQMSDDDWASQRHIVPMRTEVRDSNSADAGLVLMQWLVCVLIGIQLS